MATLPPPFSPTPSDLDQPIFSSGVRREEVARAVASLTEGAHRVTVVGAPGSGKTTVLLKAMGELAGQQQEGPTWEPICLPDAALGIGCAGAFWFALLRQLARQRGDEDARAAVEALSRELDKDRLRERAFGQLLGAADRLHLRLLVVVEELDSVLTGNLQEAEAQLVLPALAHDDRFAVLTTALPHAHLPASAGRDVITLSPLDTTGCAELWEAVAGEAPLPGVAEATRVLTGGLPRHVARLASMAETDLLGDLSGALGWVLDGHTPVLRARLAHLPTVERRVYLALASHWSPATARTVAEAARLDTNKTSALLGRLVDRGEAVVVEARPRRKTYAVADRLGALHLLQRTDDERLGRLIEFMAGFYGVSGTPLLNTYREALAAPPAVTFSEDMLRQAVTDRPDDAAAWHALARFYHDAERGEEAEQAYGMALEKDDALGEAWLALGHLLHDVLARYEESETPYRRALSCMPRNPEVWRALGTLYQEHLDRPDESEFVMRKAEALDAARAAESDSEPEPDGAEVGENPPLVDVPDPALRACALCLAGNSDAAIAALREWCDDGPVAGERVHTAVEIGAAFVSADESPVVAQELSAVSVLAPLVLALRRAHGEELNAPPELMTVAGDVSERVRELAAAWGRARSREWRVEAVDVPATVS